MSAMSPWGEIQYVSKTDTRGISFVSTAGHGGLRLSKGFAEKNLSKKILGISIFYGGYYFFEEDCAWEVPAFFNSTIFNALNKIMVKLDHNFLKETVQKWYPEFMGSV